MAEGKEKITVYRSWGAYLDELSDQQVAALMRHFFAYVDDQDPDEGLLDRKVLLYWGAMKMALKRDLVAWRKGRDTRRDNGKKGGRPKGSGKHQKNRENQENQENRAGFLAPGRGCNSSSSNTNTPTQKKIPQPLPNDPNPQKHPNPPKPLNGTAKGNPTPGGPSLEDFRKDLAQEIADGASWVASLIRKHKLAPGRGKAEPILRAWDDHLEIYRDQENPWPNYPDYRRHFSNFLGHPKTRKQYPELYQKTATF